MELMTIQIPQLVWTIIVFLLLLVILKKYAWQPILTMLDEREKRIEDAIRSAEKGKAEVEAIVNKQQELMEEAKKEAQGVIAKGQKTAEAMKADILAKAKQESEQLLEKAKREIELGKDKAIDEIKAIAVELSMMATSKLVRKSLSENDHKQLVEEAIKELGDLS